MRAGLLTETIYIYELQKTTSPSGAVTKEYVEKHKIKAHRKKLSASVGDGVNAYAEFIGNTLVFQTRKYSFLNEDMRIKYGNNFYNVVLLDPQYDKTYLITCNKIDEQVI